MTGTLTGLALRELRSRPSQTLLTLLVVTITAGTLGVAVTLRQAANDPWERTFAAGNGAHVWAIADRLGVRLDGLASLPGVTATTTVSYVNTSFVRRGVRYGLALAARGQGAVEQPVLTAGTTLRPGSIVLERSFARRLHLHVGDRLAVATESGTRTLPIVGLGVTARRQGYPRQQPGLAWTTAGVLASVEPDRGRWLNALGVRLADPDAIDAFVRRASARVGSGAHFVDWITLRDEAALDTRDNQKVLTTQGVFLLLAAGFILATVVAGRVLAQSREIGLLKAIGLTPRQVSTVYLVQYATLGLVGAVLGLLLGRLVAPFFVRTSGEVLGARGSGGLDVGATGAVLIAVVAIVAVFAFVPSWRGARRTTTEALAESLGSARGTRSRLARAAERLRLPVTVVVGLKESFSRPGRALLTAFSLSLTVAVLVAVLDLERSWQERTRAERAEAALVVQQPAPVPTVGPRFGPDPGYNDVASDRARLRPMVYAAMGILVLVGVVNLLTTAVLGVRERRRELGILKAIGLTPGQVRASVLWTHSALGLLAALIGIPLGLATYRLVGDATVAPWWWLALIIPAATAASMLATAGPAARASSTTVTEALRAE